MNYLSIDFEYNGTRNATYNLVACAITDGTSEKATWLHKDQDRKDKLKEVLLKYRDTHTLLSFNVDAEAKSLVSLGLNPIKFKWIDIQAEWKMLTNHYDKLRYGKHFIDGKVKTTYRKFYGDEYDKRPHDRPPLNLLGCKYKLLNTPDETILTEYEEKNNMRDLILSRTAFSDKEKEEILTYCTGDIHELHDIYQAQLGHYKRILSKSEYELLHKEQLWRGDAVARAACISSVGYPVNRRKVTNFIQNIPQIIQDLQEDINSQFPDREIFYWNKTFKRNSLNTKTLKKWIEDESGYASRWTKTANKDYSLSLDSWERFYSFRHDFPRHNLPAQMLRYKKLEQNLNGFKPKSVTARNKQTFLSFYGSDNRAHPYLNSYGAQSARYQPKATGFIHLKAAWMRVLVESEPGQMICGIDYGSEEFLIAALVSGDKNMIEAYKSGDVYLYFAKLAGAVPWDGKKEDYKEERNRFKSTTLGISYQMGSGALASKLTDDTGIAHTSEDAQDLINRFYEAYPVYAQWIQDNENQYCEDDKLKLPDGWYMFGDNDNRRSVGNYPIQGIGSCILRKAVQLCQDAGLKVIIPLHDALYCEIPSSEPQLIDTMSRCMRDAFAFYFEGNLNTLAHDLIRLDIDVWGPDCEEGYSTTPLGNNYKSQKIYIDPRSKSEYEQFNKYF